MTGCTAPILGHRTASGRDNCPVCGTRGYSYGGTPYSYHPSRALSPYTYKTAKRQKQNKMQAKWSPHGSTILYSPAEIRALTPVRNKIVERATIQGLHDVFLCHAWDDRKGAAKELYESLKSRGVSVWFSEENVPLGSQLLREIDKGLTKSRFGIVLVTPAFLKRVEHEGVAEKELSALLSRDLLVPVVHETTFEELREVSPLLGSRSGLSTSEEPMKEIAAKIAELATIQRQVS